MRWSWTKRLALLGVFAFIAAVYVSVSLSLRKDAFFVGDMGIKYVQIESLLRQHFKSLALVYPGATVDPDAQFFPFPPPSTFKADDRVYATFSPAFSVVSAVPYYFFGLRGLYIIPLLAGLATVALVPFFATHLRVRRPALVMLLAGLGTPLCFYSLLFWEHTLAAFFFGLGLFYAVRAFRLRRAHDVAWSGIWTGVAPWFRPEMFLALAAMAFAYLVMARSRRVRVIVVILFCVGAGLFTVPLLIFNLCAYGGPFGAHYLQNIQLDQTIGHVSWLGALGLKLRVLPQHLLFGREFFNVRWQDAALFAPFTAVIVLWVLPRFPGKRWGQTVLILFAAFLAFYVVCESRTVVGFFAASPAMLLAFAGARPVGLRKWRVIYRAGPIAFCSLVSIVFALLLFATLPVLGGVQFGPRFLLPLYLPAALLAGRALQAKWSSRRVADLIVLTAGFALVACSFSMSIRGMRFAEQQKAMAGGVKDSINQKIRQVKTVSGEDCRVLVSDLQTLALTGTLYFDDLMFFITDNEARSRLETTLSRSGEKVLLLVTRSVKPVGPVGITVAAPNAPEVPVMRSDEVLYLPFALKPVGKRQKE